MGTPHQPSPEDASRARAWALESVAGLGAGGLDLLSKGRDVYGFFIRTLYYTFRGTRRPGAVLEQCYQIGNKSLVFLSVVMGFFGMIMVFQAGVQAGRIVPDLSQIGGTYIQLLVRDLAASIGALMLATRVGAGIAAELGSMVVTEQVDALRMCAADPIDYLVKPRFIASLIMTFFLVVIAGAVALGTGMVSALVFFNIPPDIFVNFSKVGVGDVVIGTSKCIAYGAAIPIMSGYSGLTAFGGSEGVGWATTRAVVNSSLAVIILNFLISGAGYMVFG